MKERYKMEPESLRRLEERVARLEEELKQLKAQLVAQAKRSFETTAGILEGSETFKEIVRECRKIRQADRKAARTDNK